MLDWYFSVFLGSRAGC